MKKIVITQGRKIIDFRGIIPTKLYGSRDGERLFLDQGSRETSLRGEWVLSWPL